MAKNKGPEKFRMLGMNRDRLIRAALIAGCLPHIEPKQKPDGTWFIEWKKWHEAIRRWQ